MSVPDDQDEFDDQDGRHEGEKAVVCDQPISGRESVGDSSLELSAAQKQCAEFGLMALLHTSGLMNTGLATVAEVRAHDAVEIMGEDNHYLGFDLLDAAGNKVLLTDRRVRSAVIGDLTFQMNRVNGCEHAMVLLDEGGALTLCLQKPDFERLITKAALQGAVQQSLSESELN